MLSTEPPDCCADVDFSAAFADLDPVSVLMSLRGEIDMDGTGHLAHLVGWTLEFGAMTRLVVDLGRITFLGFSGIKAFADARASAAAVGCRLVLTRPGPCTAKMLETAGLLEPFGLSATVAGEVARCSYT
ncbi:STAS domain-containing protein [Actinoplanes sp. NPDC026623]|uniref:STAS domain-containing protein n=1 Tax=Actinoplanes sp. NPDC026623 TaxID=3155610 RepID=UPI0033E57301